MIGAAALAAAIAGRRVATRVARLAARAGAALPEADVTIDGDAVRLRGRGLLARAFGSRGRAADPRLAALTEGDAP